jgi:hypothetical protein
MEENVFGIGEEFARNEPFVVEELLGVVELSVEKKYLL